jgi:glutamate synthase (ferredoxin)
MRLLGHNGEINTLLGNLNWARASEAHLDAVWGEDAADLKPVVNPAFSDSANLDATLELMVRSGRKRPRVRIFSRAIVKLLANSPQK